MDDERLKRTVSKITRGIYYHHLGQPVPAGCTVDPLNLATVDRERLAAFRSDPEIANLPTYEIGMNTFQYKFGQFAENQLTAILVMRVYEWAEFVALILADGTLCKMRKNQTS
jgi:hypothetical protein